MTFECEAATQDIKISMQNKRQLTLKIKHAKVLTREDATHQDRRDGKISQHLQKPKENINTLS